LVKSIYVEGKEDFKVEPYNGLVIFSTAALATVHIFLDITINCMTKKEYILDSLINDDEAFTQIVEYFKFVNVSISYMELEQLLKEMIEEGFIRVNCQWKNEKDEYPYSLTKKGIKVWLNIKQSDNIID